MFIVWISVVMVVLWLVVSKGRSEIGGETAMDIAHKRYAAGEITRTELEEIKRNI